MESRLDDIVNFFKSALCAEKIPCEDYKECLELVLTVLGSTPTVFTLKKPGAFHKALWMALLIYRVKMFLLRLTLKKSIIK